MNPVPYAYFVELEKKHRVTVNAIKDNKECQIKCLILCFPSDLTFDHYREGLKCPEITVFNEAYEIGGQMVQNMHAFVIWRFYIMRQRSKLCGM